MRDNTGDDTPSRDMGVFGRVVVIRRTGRDGALFPLNGPICSFGRDDNCTIRVKVPEVSRLHASILVDVNTNKMFLQNESGNGTVLNGRVIANGPEELQNKDVFSISSRSFRIEFPRKGPLAESSIMNSTAASDGPTCPGTPKQTRRALRTLAAATTRPVGPLKKLAIGTFAMDCPLGSPSSPCPQSLNDMTLELAAHKPAPTSMAFGADLLTGSPFASPSLATKLEVLNQDSCSTNNAIIKAELEDLFLDSHTIAEHIRDLASPTSPTRVMDSIPTDIAIKTPLSKSQFEGDSQRKKRVTFGPELSPEIFDEAEPPATPVKRGDHATTTPRAGVCGPILRRSIVQPPRDLPDLDVHSETSKPSPKPKRGSKAALSSFQFNGANSPRNFYGLRGKRTGNDCLGLQLAEPGESPANISNQLDTNVVDAINEPIQSSSVQDFTEKCLWQPKGFSNTSFELNESDYFDMYDQQFSTNEETGDLCEPGGYALEARVIVPGTVLNETNRIVSPNEETFWMDHLEGTSLLVQEEAIAEDPVTSLRSDNFWTQETAISVGDDVLDIILEADPTAFENVFGRKSNSSETFSGGNASQDYMKPLSPQDCGDTSVQCLTGPLIDPSPISQHRSSVKSKPDAGAIIDKPISPRSFFSPIPKCTSGRGTQEVLHSPSPPRSSLNETKTIKSSRRRKRTELEIEDTPSLRKNLETEFALPASAVKSARRKRVARTVALMSDADADLTGNAGDGAKVLEESPEPLEQAMPLKDLSSSNLNPNPSASSKKRSRRPARAAETAAPAVPNEDAAEPIPIIAPSFRKVEGRQADSSQEAPEEPVTLRRSTRARSKPIVDLQCLEEESSCSDTGHLPKRTRRARGTLQADAESKAADKEVCPVKRVPSARNATTEFLEKDEEYSPIVHRTRSRGTTSRAQPVRAERRTERKRK